MSPRVAVLVTVRTLTATAAPIPALPPVDLALPLASARPSLLADDRTVTAPPASTVRPLTMVATDVEPAMLTAIAAATDTGPLEVSACSPSEPV